jgi:hypothetical protein
MYGSGDWNFCRKLDCPERQSASLRDDVLTHHWLQGYKDDASKMNAMRTALSQDGAGRDLSRLSDEMIVEQIAQLLSGGKLHVHRRHLQRTVPLRLAGPGDAAGAAAAPPTTAAAPPRVKVRIELAEGNIACPGHPLKIAAIGTPAGGTFQWDVGQAKAPAADLVDAAGKTTRSGPEVYLLGLESDTGTGNIPKQNINLSVTYTYTDGQTAPDSKPLVIHEIKFEVSDDAVHHNEYFAKEYDDGVAVRAWDVHPIMSAKPKVEIQLDALCPRQELCASNHRVGWVQKVKSHAFAECYEDVEITSVDLPLPLPDTRLIDGRAYDKSKPFPNATFVTAPQQFKKNKDKQNIDPLTVGTEDTPGVGNGGDIRAGTDYHIAWVDKESGSSLERIRKEISLTSWLAVQNVDWSKRDAAGGSAFLPGSFMYLGHFDWSVAVDVKIDVSKPLPDPYRSGNSRATMVKKDPSVPEKLLRGRGQDEHPVMPGKVVFNVAVNLPQKTQRVARTKTKK